MLQAAHSTAEERADAQVDRSNSDAPLPAEVLKVNVNGAVLRVPSANARGLAPNASSRQAPTGREQELGARIIGLPPVPARPALRASFHALQEWEGYVADVDETEFFARLVDLTARGSHEEEEAVIPRAELSDGDNARMRVGSIFRWVIGYERSPAGTKKRVSQIVFRDLPALTKSDLRDGESWARKMARSLNP